MKREFTKLMAALALLLFIAPLGMWGQTYSLTPDQTSTGSSATSYITTLTEFTYGGVSWKMNQWNPNTLQIKTNQSSAASEFRYYNTSAFPGRITSVVMTFSALTVSDASKLMFLGGTSEVTATTGGTAGTWNSTAKTLTWIPSSSENFTFFAFYQNGKAASGTNYLASSDAIVVTYETGGGDIPTPDPSDFALTGTTALTFDLYNDNGAKTISYTTSSNGTVSVANNSYVNATVDQQAKTITVTPVAVTNGNQTINVTQAPTSAYEAGEASFTVNITDNTPGVIFVAGTDTGSTSGNNSPDQMTKENVTIYSSDAAFATEQYRLYQSSVTTISVPAGYYISTIVFTGVDTSKPISNLSLNNNNGTFTVDNDNNVGTWSGNSSSVSFTANAQARASRIRVVVEQDNTPTIAVNPASLDAFSYLSTSEDPSDAQSVSIAGSNLTDDITVSVGNSSNFEISLAENSGYTNTITLSETDGSVSATPVYVRMKSGLSEGTYSGNLAITSTGASQVDIELNGNVAAVKTVPEAIAAIDAATGHTVTGAYVSGVVSYVDYFSTTNHYITYYISADGNRENELEVFHGKNLNGTDFTAQSDLLVGDQVVVYGNLTLYNNTVYEFESDNYLISFNRPAAQEYTLTVSNLSHVNMFVFNAENQSDPLFEGEGTAQVYNGTNILLSVEVEEGYGIQSLIVEGVDVASQLDESGAYTFYMPTRNVTITATAAVLPIVILCDDNTTLYGATVTLPTRDNSGDYTFAGWCVTNYEEETTTTPTIIPAGAYQTTQQSIVLYPVYTRTEGGSGTATEWHLLNNLSDADAGVYALVSLNNYAFNGTISNQGHGESTTDAFSFDANGIAASAPTGTLEITFEPVEQNGSVVGFKLLDPNTNKYLYASKNASGYLGWHVLENSYWSVHSTGNWYYPTTGGDAYLRSYNETFRTYGNNSGNLLKLAKKVQGGGTTYYTSLLTSLTKTIAAPQGDRDSWYLIASPMVGTTNVMNVQNLINTNLNDFDLYRFDQAGDEDGNEWTNWKNNGALNGFNLEKGKGYLYANNTENDVVLTFTGTPYTGDGIVTLEKKDCSNASGNFEGWNLVGNPFAQTAYIDRDCYVMNTNRNQIVLGSSREVAAMEGVFVVAASDGETMTFSTTPLGKADSKVVMNVIDNQGVADRAIVRFGEGSQLPKFQLKGNSTKVYFQQGQEEFAIVAADNEGELPVNFKASRNGRYTMSINVEDLDMNYLHLIDNKTGNDVDLLATPSYTFEASNNDYESRFRLVFNANAIEENDTEANTTFAYYNGSEWVINNPSTGSGDNATLQVIDMMGRVLSSETLNGNANVTLNQPAGIYMLRLVNGNDVKVQKVVVR